MRRRGASFDTPALGGPWHISVHPRVIKVVTANGGPDTAVFRPTMSELISRMKRDPKQYPKKKGLLQHLRAARVVYADGVEWRCVFTIDELTRTVTVLSLGPHDSAYADAARRI